VAPMMVSPVRDSPPRWRKKVKIVSVSPLQLNAAARVSEAEQGCVVSGQKVEQGQKEKGGAEKINLVNREDNMLSVVPVEKLNTVYTVANLSNGHEADPHMAAVRISYTCYFSPGLHSLVNRL
jgi:hypothetical protein